MISDTTPPHPPEFNVASGQQGVSCVAYILPVNIEIGGDGGKIKLKAACVDVSLIAVACLITGNINDIDRLPEKQHEDLMIALSPLMFCYVPGLRSISHTNVSMR